LLDRRLGAFGVLARRLLFLRETDREVDTELLGALGALARRRLFLDLLLDLDVDIDTLELTERLGALGTRFFRERLRERLVERLVLALRRLEARGLLADVADVHDSDSLIFHGSNLQKKLYDKSINGPD